MPQLVTPRQVKLASRYTRRMTTGTHFAALEASGPDGGPPTLRVYRALSGLLGEQLAEALDNPELLAGNWLLVHTVPLTETDASSGEAISEALSQALSRPVAPGSTSRVGKWLIAQLDDFDLNPT